MATRGRRGRETAVPGRGVEAWSDGVTWTGGGGGAALGREAEGQRRLDKETDRRQRVARGAAQECGVRTFEVRRTYLGEVVRNGLPSPTAWASKWRGVLVRASVSMRAACPGKRLGS